MQDDPNQKPKPAEIEPARSPYIDIPKPDAPIGPLTQPEQPVPVKNAA